jgi:hypothetical protein
MNKFLTKAAKLPIFTFLTTSAVHVFCCMIPLLSVVSNVAFFSFIHEIVDAYMLYFVLLNVGMISYSFYKIYYKSEHTDCSCKSKKGLQIDKIVLWISVALIVVSLTIH